MITTEGPMGVNDEYLINKESFAIGPNGKLSISHKAIVIFMIGTGIYRLFTKEDFREYFFRIALLYRYYGVLESFFSKEYLFEVKSEDSSVKIGPVEIAQYVGAYAGWPTHHTPFDQWIGYLPEMLRNCTISAVFSGIDLFGNELAVTETRPNNEGIEKSYRYQPRHSQPSEMDIQNARLLADIMTKELPDELFIAWKEKFPEAKKEYDNKANRKPEYHFDLDKLNDEVKEKIQEHMSQFFPGEEFEHETSRALIYLAWLWANGFVYLTDMNGFDWYVIDPVYPFDMDVIELEDGGFNLEATKDQYDLESLFSILLVGNNKIMTKERDN